MHRKNDKMSLNLPNLSLGTKTNAGSREFGTELGQRKPSVGVSIQSSFTIRLGSTTCASPIALAVLDYRCHFTEPYRFRTLGH